jgi:hypothetical protein
MTKKEIFIDPNCDISLNIHDFLKQMPNEIKKVDNISIKSKVPCFKKPYVQ